MSDIKERILRAVTVMTEEDAKLLWQLIEKQFAASWDNIKEAKPDEWDIEMLNEIKNNPDCKEFESGDNVMKKLGLL